MKFDCFAELVSGPATSGRTRWARNDAASACARTNGLPVHAPASIFASMKPEPAAAPAPGHVDAPTMYNRSIGER